MYLAISNRWAGCCIILTGNLKFSAFFRWALRGRTVVNVIRLIKDSPIEASSSTTQPPVIPPSQQAISILQRELSRWQNLAYSAPPAVVLEATKKLQDVRNTLLYASECHASGVQLTSNTNSLTFVRTFENVM